MQDIFVPTSSPQDALVGPLHTVTYVTAEPDRLERILVEGYDLAGTGWVKAEEAVKTYLGFASGQTVAINCFTKHGEGANIQVRVCSIAEQVDSVRPQYLGLYLGGATLSFPMRDLAAHEQRMRAINVESTIGIKEMSFSTPAGETYISAEIVYKAPDFAFLMGVIRPDIFIPTGPIDPATGVGGPSYSARCLNKADAVVAFFRDVLGYEIRRDTVFEVGERSALLMPQGTKERFIQGFAPGSRTGYLVLMDHGEATRPSPAAGFGPPHRGIVMWSFLTRDLAAVADRARGAGITELQPIQTRQIPGLGEASSLILADPDGFPIEIVQE